MALNTDKLRKKKSLFSTTLSSSITDSDVTIPLSSASGLPTDTAITLTIDRVDANGVSTPAKVERITGVISGNNLTVALRAQDDTSAAAHDSGAVVEDIWDADTWNDSIDGVLAEHNQDGTHDTTKVVDLATAQTLTNKTLTNPVVNYGDSMPSTNVRCRAYLATDQLNLVDGDWTVVQLGSESYDSGSDFNVATYKFVVPVTGYYQVSWNLTWDDTNMVADKLYVSAIWEATCSTRLSHSHNQSSIGSYIACGGSDILYLTAGKEIQLQCLQNSGGNTVDIKSAAGITYLAIHLLSV